MKQFDLQEYLKNPTRPIVTRDGHAARVICTDRKDEQYPIMALIEIRGGLKEFGYFYTANGVCSKGTKDARDLFFAPEKKIGWINLYKDKDDVVTDKFIILSEEDARIQRDIHEDSYIATIKIEWEE